VRAEALLEHRARVSPAHTAVVCGSSRPSYSALDDQAARFAATMLRGGLRPGDRVIICIDNSVEAVIALFGVLKAGGVFVFVNPKSPVEYLERLVADSDAAATVTREQSGALRVTWRPTASESAAPAADSDLAALVYTSGSTGEPKGVMLTHRNLTSAAASITQYLKNTDADVILSVLPLAFTYGLGQVTTAFHVGATLVLERSFTYPRVILDTIQRERVTGLPIVPTMATLLLQQNVRELRLPSLRYITNAAAALSAVKIQQLRAALPHVSFYSMYGQTECQRISYLPPGLIGDHPGSVGVPIPGTDAFVVDENGQPVRAGVVGELVVRGPHVMMGYWKQPAATAEALRPGPGGATVLHTGDLFRMDADGLLYFIERKDGMIKTRGEKVAPRQVEETIAGLDGIADVAVYGVPDAVMGEAVTAVVVLTPGASLTADDVRRHCREHLAAYMVPKVVDIRDTMPTTATGKISRRALRAMSPARETAA
jgi:long-chain acyl-CoA synthetase